MLAAALSARASLSLSLPLALAVPPSHERDHAETIELSAPARPSAEAPADGPAEPGPPPPEAGPAPVDPADAPSDAPARTRLQRRWRDAGHRFVVIPSFRGDPTIGAMPGLRLRYVWRPPGATYNGVQVDLGLRLSTRLVQQHDLRIRLRDLAGHDELIQLGAIFFDDPVFPYLGIDNRDRLRNRDLDAPFWRGDVRTLGGFFNYQEPAWTLPREQWGHPRGVLRWLVGVDFQADYIRQYEDSLLSIERPDDEGWTRRGTYLGGASWDSRDNEWSPTWGGLHEVTLALAGPWAGASSIWGRFNATFRWYRPLGTEKLVFAQRLTFDALIGDVPLFELGLFGGLSPTEGYGGREAGRGFFRRRFAAPVKGLSVTELRYQPFEWPIRRRTLGLGFKAFADIGELFRPEAFLADGAHIAGGPGLFIVWDRFFVLRADVGFSSEGVQWYVISSHSF